MSPFNLSRAENTSALEPFHSPTSPPFLPSPSAPFLLRLLPGDA